MNILILLIISIITIYTSYKFFNWLLIEKDPIDYPVKKDRSINKPPSFINKNEKLAKKNIKNQNDFALTEIPNSTQMFDKTTQNDLIIKDVSVYNNERTVL